jgi:hypothetical protein
MISFKCPTCGKVYSVKDEFSGRQGTCTGCQAKFRIPSVSAAPNIATANPTPVQGIRCPFCDSEISAAAKRCRHCGETVDVALRAAEEARRSAEEARRTVDKGPTIIVNNSASASASAVASNDYDYDYPRRPHKSPGTAAALEVLFGLLLGTFGVGHIYADNLAVGLVVMFGWWFILFVNILLCMVFIGFITLPMCWLAIMIISPIMAANSCR